MAERQSTDGVSIAIAESAATQHRPRPALANWPARVQRRPARFLEAVPARRLPDRNSAARACCLASGDVTAASRRQLQVGKRSVRCCISLDRATSDCSLSSEAVVLCCVDDMPHSKIFRREQELSDSESSEAGSGGGITPGTDVGSPTVSHECPLAWPVDEEDDPGTLPPAQVQGEGPRDDDAGDPASAVPQRVHGSNRTPPTVPFPA